MCAQILVGAISYIATHLLYYIYFGSIYTKSPTKIKNVRFKISFTLQTHTHTHTYSYFAGEGARQNYLHLGA